MTIETKPLCVVRAPCATRSGYGDMSRDIIRHFIEYNKYDEAMGLWTPRKKFELVTV
jgi:hypothetical protein